MRCDRRKRRVDSEYDPQQRSPAESLASKTHSARCYQSDDGGTDAVERATHPGQSTESHIRDGQPEHHQQRREHECDRDCGRAGDTVSCPAKIRSELCGEWTGRELSECEAVTIFIFG